MSTGAAFTTKAHEEWAFGFGRTSFRILDYARQEYSTFDLQFVSFGRICPLSPTTQLVGDIKISFNFK